jgi:transposase-like protein
MATSITAPYFHDDDKAREYLESVRWPDGPICPHCGTDGGWPIETKDHVRKNGRIQKARLGLYKCVAPENCGKQFSVTVGTVFEQSKIPLSKWLFAAYLLCSSKKGMSAHQLHRTLGVTYKTAWFLAHRIRHAMTTDGGLMGQNGAASSKPMKPTLAASQEPRKAVVASAIRTPSLPLSNVTAKFARRSLSISPKSKEPLRNTHLPMHT